MSNMEEEIICPYDPTHKIPAIRMPRHLMKCRKNFPDVDMVVCPFNGFHEMPQQELRYHMEHCPDKALLEREMQLDFGGKRLKGCTDLPKSRSSELVADDDELWDEDPSDDRFRPQRNRNRDRRRDEDTTKLRLPKKGGTAAQLASTLQVLEISDSQGCSDKEISKDTASCNRGAEVDQNHYHHSVNNKGNDLNANCNNNSSMSDVSPLGKQLSRLYHTSSDSGEESTPTNSPKSKTNISVKNKNSDLNTSIPPAAGIASSRLEPTSISHTSAQGNSAMRGLRQPQSAPKTPAFMLGRGRALPSFLSKSSVGTPDVGRQTLANCSEAAAQSRRLTELARSLGRGRGLCIRQASKQAA